VSRNFARFRKTEYFFANLFSRKKRSLVEPQKKDREAVIEFSRAISDGYSKDE
jgi:hypothetical protein